MGVLKKKVESLVTANLPGATTAIEVIPQSGKLSGYIVWDGFKGKLQRERQRELWQILRRNLNPQEERSLSAILTLTQAEMQSLSNEGDEND